MLPNDFFNPLSSRGFWFWYRSFLSRVEGKHLIYTIAARFTKGLKHLTSAVTDWRHLDADTAVSEVMFQAHGWPKARRVVLIRRRKRDLDFVRGRELFDLPGYLFQAVVLFIAVAVSALVILTRKLRRSRRRPPPHHWVPLPWARLALLSRHSRPSLRLRPR